MELSIEEKAKAYDEAIERYKVKQEYESQKVHEFIEYLFPELKESEDERIRKRIIALVNAHGQGMYKDEMFDWLEKQGKKIDAIENFDTEFEKQVSRLIASATNKEHEYSQGYVKWTANALFNYAKHELEKQSKKPVWTIGDVKDGDVLCSGQIILLFKKWEEDTDWNFAIAHAGIDISGKLQITNGHWLISNDAKPAIKEQCDLLFQKIHEAGYTWDSKKKELKKIEHKVEPIDKFEGLTDFERTLADICIAWIGEELGWKQYIKDSAEVLLKIAIKKPSDEQMEALKEACDEHWEPDGLDPLYTLYQDLKKLREE